MQWFADTAEYISWILWQIFRNGFFFKNYMQTPRVVVKKRSTTTFSKVVCLDNLPGIKVLWSVFLSSEARSFATSICLIHIVRRQGAFASTSRRHIRFRRSVRVAKERKEIYQFDSENPVLIRRLTSTRRPTHSDRTKLGRQSSSLLVWRAAAGRYRALRHRRYNRDRWAFDAESEIIQRAKLQRCERRTRCWPRPTTDKRSPSPAHPHPPAQSVGQPVIECIVEPLLLQQGSQTLSSFVLIDLRSRYSRSERDFALQDVSLMHADRRKGIGGRAAALIVDPSTVLQSNSPVKNGIMTSSTAADPLSAVAPRLTGQDWRRPAIDCGSSGTRMYFLHRIRFRPLARSIRGERGLRRTQRGRDWEIKTEQTDYRATFAPSAGELVCINAPRQTTN